MDVKIPKKIHFIWYGPEMPWYILYYVTLIKQMYKGYKIKIWGKEDFDPSTHKYTEIAYKKEKYAFITDYLRAKILYEEGGIYLDTDMVAIRNVEKYLKSKIVLGFEYTKMVGTGFVAAEPGHPFFRRVLKIYEQFDYLDKENFKFLINNELWTLVLSEIYDLKLNNKTQLLPGDIKIYSLSYFSEMKLTTNSVFLHDHKLSWTSPSKARVMHWFLEKIRAYNYFFHAGLVMTKIMYFRKNKKRLKILDAAEEKTQEINTDE